jgi:putative FmdB family regulatory protein
MLLNDYNEVVMPIYEYKCDQCGKISEFLVASSNSKSKACSHCGGKKLKKQLSVFAPRIKEGASKKCFGCTDNTCPHSQQ